MQFLRLTGPRPHKEEVRAAYDCDVPHVHPKITLGALRGQCTVDPLRNLGLRDTLRQVLDLKRAAVNCLRASKSRPQLNDVTSNCAAVRRGPATASPYEKWREQYGHEPALTCTTTPIQLAEAAPSLTNAAAYISDSARTKLSTVTGTALPAGGCGAGWAWAQFAHSSDGSFHLPFNAAGFTSQRL